MSAAVKNVGLAEEWLLGQLQPSPAVSWLASQHWIIRSLIYKVVEGLAVGAIIYFVRFSLR